jgi:hypothetical protein
MIEASRLIEIPKYPQACVALLYFKLLSPRRLRISYKLKNVVFWMWRRVDIV